MVLDNCETDARTQFDSTPTQRTLRVGFQRDPHPLTSSYLVDPASSHMLVLKIKPCMSKCSVLLHTRLRTAHYNSYSLFDGFFSVDNRGNSRADTC